LVSVFSIIKYDGSDAIFKPMNDERKQPIPLWPDGCGWILCSSSIGAILKIFLTPLYTGANDIGVAGLGNLLYHPVVHGSIGAIGGAFIGSLAFFLFRNGKQFKLPLIIQNTYPLNAEESVNVIETAIRKAAKKSTGELTKADFEKVTRLYLDYNQLTDVKSLENLTQLKELYLIGNQLTDVKGLEKLTQLKNLYLIGNQLTSVKGLENLDQLKVLSLRNNPDLTKAQIDELKKALPKCDIRSNPTK
jgi:Leucine-rich repeat (LRR) protein